MKRICAVFYWLGGVIVPSLEQAAALALLGQAPAEIDVAVRSSLFQLVEQLSRGAISAEVFCRRAVERGESHINPADLPQRMVEAAAPRPDVLEVVRTLPEPQRWLVCDYPDAWYHTIAGHAGLRALFPEARCLSLPGLGLARLVPDVFYHVVTAAHQPMDDCLLVERASPRAVAAVRLGLSSTVFVSAWRLARDFRLRGLLGEEQA